MRDFFLLVRVRGRVLKNAALRCKRRNIPGRVVLLLLALAFVAGDYLFFKRIIDYIVTLPLDVAELMIPQFLMVICLTFFSMLVFSNIIASISTFYLSGDLELIISSPLGMRSVFSARLLQTMLNSSWMLILFGIPIFVALGASTGATAAYYLGMLATIVPFIVVPSCLGIMVTVVLMRFFPARRTHQFLTVVGLVFMGGLIMFFRFLKPEKFLGKKMSLEAIEAFVESLKVPDYAFLPSTWAARSLFAGTYGDYGGMALWTGIAWVAAIALVAVAICWTSRYYYDGWSLAYGGRNVSRVRPRQKLYRQIERFLGFVQPGLRAVLMKDFKTFWRDPSQWTQLFMLGALVVVYIFNIRNLPMDTLILKNFVAVLNIGLAGVVMAAIAVRFVFPTTSVEGKSFWILKSSPLDFSGYLWGKFVFYFVPLLLLAETLVVLSNLFLAVDIYLMTISVVGVFFITVGLTGLGVGLGAVYPVFEYENIAEIATSTGAIYYMLISLAYIGIMVMFGVRPIWAHFSQKFLDRQVGGWEIYVCYAVIVLLTIGVTVLPIRMGTKALRREEI